MLVITVADWLSLFRPRTATERRGVAMDLVREIGRLRRQRDAAVHEIDRLRDALARDACNLPECNYGCVRLAPGRDAACRCRMALLGEEGDA